MERNFEKAKTFRKKAQRAEELVASLSQRMEELAQKNKDSDTDSFEEFIYVPEETPSFQQKKPTSSSSTSAKKGNKNCTIS